MSRRHLSEAASDPLRNRKSRAGEHNHRSGLYVASPRKPAPEPSDETAAETQDDGAHWRQPSRKPVTLPTLKFLEKKRIGGELI
jgi:hypothetical protein